MWANGKWGRKVELRAWAKEGELLMKKSCRGSKDERFASENKISFLWDTGRGVWKGRNVDNRLSLCLLFLVSSPHQ